MYGSSDLKIFQSGGY